MTQKRLQSVRGAVKAIIDLTMTAHDCEQYDEMRHCPHSRKAIRDLVAAVRRQYERTP